MKLYIVNINSIYPFLEDIHGNKKYQCSYYFYDKKQALKFANNFQEARTKYYQSKPVKKLKEKDITKLNKIENKKFARKIEILNSLNISNPYRSPCVIYEIEIEKSQFQPIIYYVVGINSIGKICKRKIRFFDNILNQQKLKSYQENPYRKIGEKGHEYKSLISLDYAEQVVNKLYNNQITIKEAIQQEKNMLKPNTKKINQQNSLDFIEL